jgi:hypothetical protein
MTKDTIWIFSNFGCKAGLQFVWETLKRTLRRVFRSSSSPIHRDENEIVTLRVDVPQRTIHNHNQTLN